uniref:Putative secreted protein n=1 Tax=Anopheles triannulatus TaxID=58253 RepID=A0A2M4B7A7_9DIPT
MDFKLKLFLATPCLPVCQPDCLSVCLLLPRKPHGQLTLSPSSRHHELWPLSPLRATFLMCDSGSFQQYLSPPSSLADGVG